MCSCSQINNPVKEYFEYYTDTAAIEQNTVDFNYQVNYAKIICLSSNEDKSISLFLRNPQNYILDFEYNFDNSAINEIDTETKYIITQNPTDKSRATLKFTKQFLTQVDLGIAIDSETGKITKDISGTITLKDTASGRSFESYHLSLNANSAPPRLRYGMFQRNLGKNENGTCYVLCLNIPNLIGTVHEKDTHKISIDGNSWDFEFSNASISLTGSSELSTTRPLNLLNIDGTPSIFETPDGYLPLYYTTQLNPDTENSEIKMNIELSDTDGLYYRTTISNQPTQLVKPEINILQNQTEFAKDPFGYYPLIITHSKGTRYYDKDEDKFLPGAQAQNMPNIEYIVKQGSTVVASGTGIAPITVKLRPGKNYSIDAYAYYQGYVDSEKIDQTDGVNIRRNKNYYVSKNGHDDIGTGYSANPYRTISQCFSAIEKERTDFSDSEADQYTITLQTDITPLEGTDFKEGQENYITFDKSYPVLIQGESSLKTIDLQRSATQTGRGICIEASSNELTLKNVKITGGCMPSTDFGAGIKYNGGTLNIAGTVIIEGNYLTSNDDQNQRINSNLHISDNTSVKKIKISEPLTGSKIGISINSDLDPSIGKNVIFTTNYNSFNSNIAPSYYFFSDKGFGITSQDNEAALAVSGGTISEEIADSITISADQSQTSAGTAKIISFCAKNKDGTEIPESDLSFTFKVKVSGTFISESFNTKQTKSTLKNNQIEFTSDAKPAKYVIIVTVTYNRTEYETDIPFEITL